MTAIEQLETRFSNHPARLFLQSLDGAGRFSAELDFQTEEEGNRPINCELSLRLDLPDKKMQAVGYLESNQKKTELMLYMDPSVMMIDTDVDPESAPYGIHYDSFREDIRNIPYLSSVVSESVFDGWEQRLFQVKAAAHWNYSLPKLPSVSADTVRKLLWGLVFMPYTREWIPCEEGYGKHCCRMTYELPPERLRTYRSGAEGGLKVSFVLCGNRLIQLDAEAESGEVLRIYRFTSTENAAEGPLRLQAATLRSGVSEEFSCIVVTKVGENRYSESWEIYRDYEGKEPAGQFAYTWYPQRGDMQIFLPTEDPIMLNLKFCETGIRVESEEWSRIISGIWHNRSGLWEQKKVRGSVMLEKGGPFPVPQCIYLKDWSLEQLFKLMATLKSVAEYVVSSGCSDSTY